jgi:hypothetical protein
VTVRLNFLGPLFHLSSDNYGGGYFRAQFLFALGQYFRGEKPSGERELSFRLIPFAEFKRTWFPRGPLRARSAVGGAAARSSRRGRTEYGTDERVLFRFFHFLFGYEREDDLNARRLFILGGSPVGPDGRKEPIALMAYERGPSTDFEHHLLWRVLLFRRHGAGPLARVATTPEGAAPAPGIPGLLPAAPPRRAPPSERWRGLRWLFRGSPRTSVRVVPFLSYDSDWETDAKRVSILLGLLSYERGGGERRGRVFWLFRWRRPRLRPRGGS